MTKAQAREYATRIRLGETLYYEDRLRHKATGTRAWAAVLGGTILARFVPRTRHHWARVYPFVDLDPQLQSPDLRQIDTATAESPAYADLLAFLDRRAGGE
jgi:hypothetical protein